MLELVFFLNEVIYDSKRAEPVLLENEGVIIYCPSDKLWNDLKDVLLLRYKGVMNAREDNLEIMTAASELEEAYTGYGLAGLIS